MGIFRITIAIIGLLISCQLRAQEIFAWKFGMTPEEVAAVIEYAPYKSFSNGDLETYEAKFEGEKENFQFFFSNDQPRRLRRVGIYLYEGQDISAAEKEWLELYGALSRLFGEIETPNNTAPTFGKHKSEKAFTTKAANNVLANGKTQMAPISQPRDAFVFSTFSGREFQGAMYYNVILYFDALPEKAVNPASDSSSTP